MTKEHGDTENEGTKLGSFTSEGKEFLVIGISSDSYTYFHKFFPQRWE